MFWPIAVTPPPSGFIMWFLREDSPARRAEVLAEAREQLRRHADDPRVRQTLGEARLHPLVLLHSGWALVWREEVELP